MKIYILRADHNGWFGGAMWVFTNKRNAQTKHDQIKKMWRRDKKMYRFISLITTTAGKAVFNA